MNSNEKIIQTESPTRRKFVWGVGVLSLFAAFAAIVRFPFSTKRNVISCKPDSNKRTIKMLTQDGTLVEIDESLLTASRKKITNNELQNWIKK